MGSRNVHQTDKKLLHGNLMKSFQEFNESIMIPINIGDVILGGKFKNKKIVVKEIGRNEKGDITINGRPLLKFRIMPNENV